MKSVLIFFSALVLLISCNNNDYKREAGAYQYSESIEDVAVSEEQEMQANTTVTNNEITIERKLIKTGDISFETNDLSATRNQIAQAVQKYNGYISGDNEYKSSQNITSSLIVRIPSKNFDAFLNEISSKVERFDTKNISVNDVTEQYLDIEARLKVKKELEKRYGEILKKASSVKEIIEVERELNKVRSEIESIEGRLKYLQNQVSYSTLTIRFYKEEVNSAYSKSFGRLLADAFGNGIDNVKWFFIGLVNIWPFILLLVLLIVFIKKRIKRKK
ncbi:DUF4349 domain-containing protein [Tenacibaculum tangerinum]|uniref:DUF4349 domain-containing protein n=1 Tax=Tenacibaculum tangerinum TaxID=3038772 RepID=A0ABY8L765_9FLAO|nr:DUF4349 domain-containing protein [Tenacibaculum tangerinum]WGH75929.1 DUF4349 domain-containing protein [Tenacibaculum tangerinum]